MRVVVKLFARLRDVAGTAELERQVPEGATVESVWHGLVEDHPDLQPFARSISSAVNAEYVRWDTTLRDGDEVAFLPPVSGG